MLVFILKYAKVALIRLAKAEYQ